MRIFIRPDFLEIHFLLFVWMLLKILGTAIHYLCLNVFQMEDHVNYMNWHKMTYIDKKWHELIQNDKKWKHCHNAVSPKGTCIVNAYCQFLQQVCTNFMQKYLYPTVGIQSLEIGKKILHLFENVFHVYLMNGLQKYQKKIFFHGGFLR